MVVYQLEGIPVAGDHHAVPAVFSADPSGGAENIVGLPALERVGGNVHGRKNFLENGHLRGQIVGHGLPGGLVALVGGVAEGGALLVKGHGQSFGLFLVQQGLHDVEEAVDGAGGLTGLGGQIANAVECPVDDAVAVQNHEFHIITLLHHSLQ